VGCVFAAIPAAAQAATRVDLGTADPFSVLAYSTVTNTGATSMSGNLGLHPGSAVTGGPLVLGESHLADGPALQAKNSLDTAFVTTAGLPSVALGSAELAGRRLTTGVYNAPGDLLLGSTEVQLDAQGDPNAVFIFQVGRDLTLASSTRVSLINGAQACNVFWQVERFSTLGTASRFVGTLMSHQRIAAQTGATIQGRLFSRVDEVTLENNVITTSACAAGTDGDGGSGGTGTGGTGGNAPGTTPGTGAPAGSAPADQAPPGSQSSTPTRNGTARLNRPPTTTTTSRRGPARPCTEGFTARVRGKLIRRVIFSLDGKRIGTRTKSAFSVYVRAARAGSHVISARVGFKDATRSRTLKFRYRACAAQVLQPRRGPSQFTG
jgi:hypothetical protein